MQLTLLVVVTIFGTTVFAQNCTEDQFQCNDGTCIPESWHCDGATDCADYSDELGCPCPGFLCSNGLCIRDSQVCDGISNCWDGADEENCTYSTTTPGPCTGFECPMGGCIPIGWVCDGNNDCGDFSDEQNCPSTTTTLRPPCAPDQLCDGQYDCPGSIEDELGCPCEDDLIECPEGGRCIEWWWFCDTVLDCPYGGDEVNCTESVPKSK